MISSGAARGTVRHGMHALQKAHLAVRAPFHQHAQRQGSSWRLRHAQSYGCNAQVAQRDPRSHLLKAVPTHSALLHHTLPALQDREGPSGNEVIGMKLAWQPQAFYICPCIFTSLSFAQPASSQIQLGLLVFSFVSAASRSEAGLNFLFRRRLRGSLAIARAANQLDLQNMRSHCFLRSCYPSPAPSSFCQLCQMCKE